MRNNALINRRNKLIYEAYAELWGKGQREELIWPELVIRFHLEETTLYRIVLKFSRAQDASQFKLPLNNQPLKQLALPLENKPMTNDLMTNDKKCS